MEFLKKTGSACLGFRATPELIKLCRELGINVSETVREALAREVTRQLRSQRQGKVFTKNPFLFKPTPRPKRKSIPSQEPAATIGV